MILTSMLIGAAVGFLAGSVLAYFWKDLVVWLKRAVEKVQVLIGKAVYGIKIYIQRLNGRQVKELSRHYSKNGNRWVEHTATREISEEDVPSDILAIAKRTNGLTDITDELSMELS